MDKYYKLVRDKIPQIIKKDGQIPRVTKLKMDKFKRELLKKLVEEASETLKAENNEELAKEIADILEVIDYIIKTFKLNKKEIEKLKRQRKKLRGGFDKKIFLEYIE